MMLHPNRASPQSFEMIEQDAPRSTAGWLPLARDGSAHADHAGARPVARRFRSDIAAALAPVVHQFRTTASCHQTAHGCDAGPPSIRALLAPSLGPYCTTRSTESARPGLQRRRDRICRLRPLRPDGVVRLPPDSRGFAGERRRWRRPDRPWTHGALWRRGLATRTSG